MVKRLLLYVACVLMTIILFFLFNDPVITVLLLMEGVYFLFGIIQIVMFSIKLKPEFLLMNPIAEKDRKIAIRIRLNKILIFSPNVLVVFNIENSLSGEKQKIKIFGNSNIKRDDILETFIKSNDCGSIQITFKEYYIYDSLFIFKKRIKVNKSQRVLIYPSLNFMPIEITKRTRDFMADSEIYSDTQSGNDSSELFQIRNYTENDSIRNIHWKMSARADKLLVKDNGKPEGVSVLLVFDAFKEVDTNKRFKNKKHRENQMRFSALDIIASISFSLLHNNCNHVVSWYNQINDTVIVKKVISEEDFYEMLNEIVFIKTYDNREEADNEIEDAFKNNIFSTIIRVGLENVINIGEESYDVPRKNGMTDWNSIAFKV